MAYRPASPSVPLSAYPIKGSIFHIDADGGAWDLIAFAGKKKEVFSINNGDRGYQVFADVETGAQSARSWTQASGWTAVTAFGGGGGGSYLDKVTTTPQSVASAVTWAETQSMSKGLRITGGWYGSASPQLFYTTDDTAYTLSQQYSNARQLVHVVREARSAGAQSEVATEMIAADDGLSSTWKARITDDGVNESLLLSQIKLTSSRPLDITGAHTDGWSLQMPAGSWIMPTSPGSLYLTSHTNPAPTLNGSVLHLTTTPMLALGDGTKVLGRVRIDNGYSELYSEASANGSYGKVEVVPGSYSRMAHYDSVSGESASVQLRYDYAHLSARGGQVRVVDGAGIQLSPAVGNYVQIQGLTTGSVSGLLGYDASGNIIQAGSAPAGGFVGLSGHNDCSTPWSIGNAASWVLSDAGYWFDQTGTYQNHIKGNLLIDQGVSNVATLYRQAFAVDSTICLMYDAQDSLGTQVRYAEACGQVKVNTSGTHDGEWYLKIAQDGAMVERIRATQEGGVIRGIWRGDYSGYGMGTTALDIGYARIGPKLAVDISSSTAPMYQMEIDSTKVYQNFNLYYSGGFQSKAAVLPSAQMIWDSATGGFVWYTSPAGSPASLTQILALSSAGKLGLIASTAATAPFSLPTGVAVTSPVTGDMWSAAADQMQWRSGANTRRFGFLEVAQTWSAVQTYSATPVISSTTASTTAGALYKRTNFGHVGYEAGMAQEFLANVYTGPVGTALTNSTTETDVTGGTAVFGTRTTSTSVWQNGTTICGSTTALITNTASANTITFKVKYGATTVMTLVASVAVVATAQAIKIWFEGVATAAPGASVETIWLGGIEGGTILSLTSITNGATNVATNAATAVSMTAQWGTALTTSTYHTKATKINLI